MVKVKTHRGEPLNEKADTQAESARQLPSEHRQWTTRTQTMTYEWRDNDGVKHVTAWSKALRSAMLTGCAEYQMQSALNRAVDNWIKIRRGLGRRIHGSVEDTKLSTNKQHSLSFMSSTNSGLQRIQQAANTGAQSDLMDSTRWGWRCMLPTSRNGQLEKTGYHNMGGRVPA